MENRRKEAPVQPPYLSLRDYTAGFKSVNEPDG